MILLTGATGNVGNAVLRRLTARGERVRCLVRDPRGLGAERVRVQIALGDLSNPSSFRNALRGVDTVVHLAAAIRDQPRASIEELNAIATLRLLPGREGALAGHGLDRPQPGVDDRQRHVQQAPAPPPGAQRGAHDAVVREQLRAGELEARVAIEAAVERCDHAAGGVVSPDRLVGGVAGP